MFCAAALSYPHAVPVPVNVLRLCQPLRGIQPINIGTYKICCQGNLTTCLTAAWNAFIAAYLNSFILGYIVHPLWPNYILVQTSKYEA